METVSPELVLADRSTRVDSAVAAAFDRAQPNVTVIAVGGYGRRELFPYSDVDLLLLVDKPPDHPRDKEPLSEFLRILWDEGLRISHSVRTVADCCELHEGNLELTISLLDQRYICGDSRPFAELEMRFPKFLAAQRSTVAQELSKAARARHAKYQGTIYHLEPNVKEHPGALRDLHVIHWLSKIGGTEAEDVAGARQFLYSVRISLHERFRRDNNPLNFEAQEAIFEDPSESMRTYYRGAREIFRAAVRAIDVVESANAGLLALFRDWRGRLSTTEFTVSRERVYLRDPQRLEADPGIIMRLMLFISRHKLQLAPDTERRLRTAKPVTPLWTQMRELLSVPHCTFAIRVMHETGVLEKIIPEWERIDCLVVRDFYHRYTVDEHTLLTLQAIDELLTTAPSRSRLGTDAPGTGRRSRLESDVSEPRASASGLQTRFAELATEIDRPDLLRFALLMHDTGKGEGDHVAKSGAIAEGVLDRFGAPAADRATIQFLIRHHLDLSSIMTSRDLGDPATARHIADRAETVERLKLLTLMTYADVSSVNPTAMSPWRLEQLWRTYAVAHEELTRELESERIHPEHNGPRSEFLEGFPTRYLRTHTDAEIDRHMELAGSGNIVDIVRHNGTYQMTVIAPDRPFLLASISGALASFGLNILKAEAFANRQGMVLDTFVFSDPLRTLELNPSEAERLRDTVTRCILGKTDVKQLLKKRTRPNGTTRIKPSIAFNNDVSQTATLIEIVAEDRPGLLYDLASAISAAGCNIEVVLIDTEAHKALDVFYVTSGGRKLSSDVEELLRSNLQSACAGGLPPP